MKQATRCDYCGDPIEGEPVKRGSRVYCCEACAFEAARSADCAGRTDTTLAHGAGQPPDQ